MTTKEETNMKVSKVKIRVENSDGTFSESETVMPYRIADRLHAEIVDWKSRWRMTPSYYEKFLNNSKPITP